MGAMLIAPCLHCNKLYHIRLRQKHPSFALTRCSRCKLFVINFCSSDDPCSYTPENFEEIYKDQFPEIVANMLKAISDTEALPPLKD